VAVTKFTQPIEFPADPDPTTESGATIGQVEQVVSEATEPTVDLTILFENALA
jgi:hypothetical protein